MINNAPLINKVVNLFGMRQRLNKTQIWSNQTAFTKPFITIAREPGSGGAPISRMVAEKLGFLHLDDNLLDEMSQNVRRRKAILKALDEKTRTSIEEIVDASLNPEYLDGAKFVSEMAKIMLSYALKGKVVIVGRGANFITPFAKGLHVNITAPYAVRIQRAMDYEGYTHEKAEDVIGKIEKERKAFVKQYLKKDPSKLNSYDLTINTALFPLEASANLIADAFYLKFPRTLKIPTPSVSTVTSAAKVPVRAVRKLFHSVEDRAASLAP